MAASATRSRTRGGQHRRRRFARTQIKRRTRRGDWLVQQVRSSNNVDPDQHDTLAGMGLLKIGRSSLFFGDRPEAWGQISTVQHLVAVRALTQEPPKTKYRVPLPAVTSLQKPLLYEVEGREAHHFAFDGEGFLSVEPYEDSVAINWSTALPIATVLERLDAALVRSVKVCEVFDQVRDAHQELEAPAALEDLRLGRSSYPFVRLETDELVLVWQRPVYPRHVDEDVSPGRIGIVTTAPSAAMLLKLLRLTATPTVGASAAELVADIESVSHAND